MTYPLGPKRDVAIVLPCPSLMTDELEPERSDTVSMDQQVSPFRLKVDVDVDVISEIETLTACWKPFA